MSWRASVIAGEVFRNLKSRALVWLLLGVTATATVAGLAVAELQAGSSAVELRQKLDLAGANVVVIEAPSQGSSSEGSLNAGRCVALNSQVGVVLAGAERLREQIELQTAPGSPILPVETVGPTVAIWDPTLANTSRASSGAWATNSLLERLGVGPGSPIIFGTTSQALVVEGNFAPLRAPQMGARVVYPGMTSALADRCWVEVTAPLSQDKLFSLSAWFAADAPVVVRPLLDTTTLQANPALQYQNRITRYGWVAVGLVIGVLWTMVIRSRRGEMALLLTVGAGRLCTVGQVVAEASLVAVLAWSTGTGLGVVWWNAAYSADLRPMSVLWAAMGSTVLAVSLALTIATVATGSFTFGSLLQALKNRD